jgi:hypothetical protein
MNRYLHFSLFLIIFFTASIVQAKSKTPGWAKQLYHSWRITKIDIPGEKAPDGLGYRIQFFKDNQFAANIEKGFVMDSFYTFENGKNRFLVVSAIVFHIDKLDGGVMELSVGVPFIQRLPTVHISLESETEPVVLDRGKLLHNWRTGMDYNSYLDLSYSGKPFYISFGNDGKFSQYMDTVLSSGTWELIDNILKLTHADGKTEKYAVKMVSDQAITLALIGTQQVIQLQQSHNSPEQMVWKKENSDDAYYETPYYGQTMTDTAMMSTDTMVEYDSTVMVETALEPPVAEPYIEDTRPAEEFLLDTFVAKSLLPFDADVILPYKKVTLTFSKDSTYTLVYNGKTEKGRFKFYLNRDVIVLQTATSGPRYCPIYVAWDYTGGQRNGITSITVTMGLPSEKDIKRVVMEKK